MYYRWNWKGFFLGSKIHTLIVYDTYLKVLKAHSTYIDSIIMNHEDVMSSNITFPCYPLIPIDITWDGNYNKVKLSKMLVSGFW